MEQTATPPTPETVTTPVVEDESLAAHETSFGADAKAARTATPDLDGGGDDDEPEVVTVPVERDKDGKFVKPTKPTRHRTEKDSAGPGDVPRIRELTKKLREAEAEVSRLRTPLAVSETRDPATPHATTVTAKPTWGAFEARIGEAGGYDSWGAAQDAYIDARDEWRAAQAKTESQAQQVTKADLGVDELRKAIMADYGVRAAEFAKTTPDFHEKLAAAGDLKLPHALTEALITADNGPKLAYHLASHPEVLDEYVLLAVSLPVNEQSVGILQRRLTKLAEQTAPTGSVASPRLVKATPRPPNPVRTGPMNTGDELPGDESSLAEHEKAFGRRRR